MAGHGFARHLIEVDLFGKLRVQEPQDLLDRGLCAVQLLIQRRITQVIARPCTAFVAQGQVDERLKLLPHPVSIHGPHPRSEV